MQTDLLNIGLAFLEGLALIASPCILPILPIILSASIEGSRRRPYGVIVGFILSFSLFTFFSRQLVLLFGLDLNLVRNVSFGLLFLLGCVMVSSYLTEKFNNLTQGFANVGLKASQNDQQTGFGGGLLFGALVGLIWTPCAGPILAAVIVQTILQHSNLGSFLTIIAFALGAAIPMLVIILFGRTLTTKIKTFQSHARLIRKILGLIIILAVLGMVYGNYLYMPNPTASNTLPTSKNISTSSGTQLLDGLNNPYPAPDFKDITAWINSPPLHMQDLKGKVVLIDFWAFSCINCIRTLPYLTDWYKKYHDQGLVIVGVHSPEFDFERDLKNVQNAVQTDGITYPVALDNDFATWRNYNNSFWPAHYLIDKNGMVVYTHFGEGKYDVTENNIRYLLGLSKQSATHEHAEHSLALTPETYLGYVRSNAFLSPEAMIKDQSTQYTYPVNLAVNQWALKGAWKIGAEKITNTAGSASIKIKFSAQKVFAVMGSSNGMLIKATILFDGQKAMSVAGQDVHNSEVSVTNPTLYKLLSLPEAGEGELEIIVGDPGLELYTFTFG